MTPDTRRDLNPHKPARLAMCWFGHEYAKSGLGSMGFWDKLPESRKRLCREVIEQILNSPDEVTR